MEKLSMFWIPQGFCENCPLLLHTLLPTVTTDANYDYDDYDQRYLFCLINCAMRMDYFYET